MFSLLVILFIIKLYSRMKPPWVFFTFFKLYEWYQIAQSTTNAVRPNFFLDFKISRFFEQKYNLVVLQILHWQTWICYWYDMTVCGCYLCKSICQMDIYLFTEQVEKVRSLSEVSKNLGLYKKPVCLNKTPSIHSSDENFILTIANILLCFIPFLSLQW